MLHAGSSEFRRRLAHFLDRVVNDRVPLLVTRRSRPPVVLLAQSEHDRLLARLSAVALKFGR